MYLLAFFNIPKSMEWKCALFHAIHRRYLKRNRKMGFTEGFSIFHLCNRLICTPFLRAQKKTGKIMMCVFVEYVQRNRSSNARLFFPYSFLSSIFSSLPFSFNFLLTDSMCFYVLNNVFFLLRCHTVRISFGFFPSLPLEGWQCVIQLRKLHVSCMW